MGSPVTDIHIEELSTHNHYYHSNFIGCVRLCPTSILRFTFGIPAHFNVHDMNAWASILPLLPDLTYLHVTDETDEDWLDICVEAVGKLPQLVELQWWRDTTSWQEVDVEEGEDEALGALTATPDIWSDSCVSLRKITLGTLADSVTSTVHERIGADSPWVLVRA